MTELTTRKFRILKVIGGLILGLSVGGFLLYSGWDVPTKILVFILGGLAGWIAGILFSPNTTTQRQAFGQYRAGIATFLSGIALAKLEQYLGEYLRATGTDLGSWFEHVLYSLIGFGLGILTTFVGRTADELFAVDERISDDDGESSRNGD
ncbi:MAG: hypothetical protein KBF76_13530 [Verrucomicrobiales bacterium]|nr:hypothetical protein [Verrucomicrobiales bacterium]